MPESKPLPHRRSVLLALFVTVLWSTSWVLIKIGLKDMPALTFAGLRYTLAFACLLPFTLQPKYRQQIKSLKPKEFGLLALLGLLYYSVTQGSQFLGLAYLPAATISLLLNFTTIIVVIFGIFLLKELPSRLQWLGIVINLAGVIIYFYPITIASGELFGLVVVVVGVFANAVSSILGRKVNRDVPAHPIVITTVSMGIGGILLLASGLIAQPLPHLTLIDGLIIAWLAVVNTAFAFSLWNLTLQTLTAMESSLINSTMLLQIALLAWVFLGESLGIKEITGLVLAGLGVLVVQLRIRHRPAREQRQAVQQQLPPTS
jgi:drug/metabolite transporter (DMT)-like permease